MLKKLEDARERGEIGAYSLEAEVDIKVGRERRLVQAERARG